MKTIDIKGKEYITVNERLIYFRDKYPDHALTSEIVNMDNGACIVKARIEDAAGRLIATGHAREVDGDSYINKTSFVENCETSAWGRALANMGIGIDVSVASADEVQNAILNKDKQPDKPEVKKPKAKLATAEQYASLKTLMDGLNIAVDMRTTFGEWFRTGEQLTEPEGTVLIPTIQFFWHAFGKGMATKDAFALLDWYAEGKPYSEKMAKELVENFTQANAEFIG